MSQNEFKIESRTYQTEQMNKKLFTLPLSLIAVVLALLGVAPQAYADHDALFQDYPAKVEAATALAREYMKTHPGQGSDSLRHNVIAGLSDGRVASSRVLTPTRKRKLSAREVFELCRPSSLVVCRFEHNNAYALDSAYSNASAVALTSDGICATNYHVVADLVLSGALGHEVKNDLMRFLMDHEGNIYPFRQVLHVDPINDMAIIRVDTNGRKLTPASIGTDVPQGTTVYCLSHPSGAYYHFTDGMVSNCTRSTNKRTGRDKYILEITSDYGVGASGGPIFDDCGNLVALVSSTFSLYAQPQQYRNFQMAYKQTVPVFLIRECFTD
ncbi:serine protease [Duncaniella sp. C9]|jgi:S1-C subfamily serine protease|nr:serine protease [Duncaniella sp. C9]QCP72270.1 trypsin-like peptidase domain-containing protein [Duncaniella sp. B8]